MYRNRETVGRKQKKKQLSCRKDTNSAINSSFGEIPRLRADKKGGGKPPSATTRPLPSVYSYF